MKIECLGLIDIPKLFIVRLLFFDTLSINGHSPFAKTFHL